MAPAVWWPSSDSRSTSTTRYLEGEISLAKDLRPTSEMGHFSISVSSQTKERRMVLIFAFQYAVVLRPFDALGFTSDATTVLSEPVQIATMKGKGPRPIAYAPPAYSPVTQRNEDNTYVPTYNAGTFTRWRPDSLLRSDYFFNFFLFVFTCSDHQSFYASHISTLFFVFLILAVCRSPSVYQRAFYIPTHPSPHTHVEQLAWMPVGKSACESKSGAMLTGSWAWVIIVVSFSLPRRPRPRCRVLRYSPHEREGHNKAFWRMELCYHFFH